jgi:hypothetical protein
LWRTISQPYGARVSRTRSTFSFSSWSGKFHGLIQCRDPFLHWLYMHPDCGKAHNQRPLTQFWTNMRN